MSELRCERCNHTWKPRKTTGKVCPGCGSKCWNKSRAAANCQKCGHEWLITLHRPSYCPKCHSAYWDSNKEPVGNKGKNNPRWNNGASGYPNHYQLKKNRLVVLEQANYTCQECGGHTNETHHKDGTKTNHSPSNLQPLCHKCQMSIYHKEIYVGGMNRKPELYPIPVKEIALLVECCTTTIRFQILGKRRSLHYGTAIDRAIASLRERRAA